MRYANGVNVLFTSWKLTKQRKMPWCYHLEMIRNSRYLLFLSLTWKIELPQGFITIQSNPSQHQHLICSPFILKILVTYPSSCVIFSFDELSRLLLFSKAPFGERNNMTRVSTDLIIGAWNAIPLDVTKRKISTINSPIPYTSRAHANSDLLIVPCLLSPNKSTLLTHRPTLLRSRTNATSNAW